MVEKVATYMLIGGVATFYTVAIKKSATYFYKFYRKG